MNINILLFDDFETLDAFGPAEVFGRIDEFDLHFLSVEGGIITSRHGIKTITEKLSEADKTGIFLVPGGKGTRVLVNNEKFIKELYSAALESRYCLTVCTGSALLAKTNLLNGCKATSNKRAFEWVKSINTNVDWVSHARWVVDGKFYTSSGVSAGIDMALGFISDILGEDKASEVAEGIEYIWNMDKDNDTFAK